MQPLVIAPESTRIWRWRSSRITIEPHIHVVVVELLAPEEPCERLSLHVACILRQRCATERFVKGVCFGLPLLEELFGIGKRGLLLGRRQAQQDCLGRSRS